MASGTACLFRRENEEQEIHKLVDLEFLSLEIWEGTSCYFVFLINAFILALFLIFLTLIFLAYLPHFKLF